MMTGTAPNDAMYSGDRSSTGRWPSPAFGRTWGFCPPFILANVATDTAPAARPQPQDYADARSMMSSMDATISRADLAVFRQHAVIGSSGAMMVKQARHPPRLYNQVVVSGKHFSAHAAKINVLAAINR
jgi:hypothetical protein